MRKHPSQATKRLRFQLTGSAAEAINVHCRKVTRFAGGEMMGQNVKVSVVSMRRRRGDGKRGDADRAKNEIKF
ncbi:hypothetical protein [Serratia ureilytica]|uniref:hypothetical protein n=1 Tax=Serratia ureilytica TaxID=300181 RepID=UPI001F053A4D|nr:hypothetical protein [Serratia ureilytica]UMK55245.1 hypothetical protein L2D49_09440 [Serratia ureilytica]